MICVLDENLVCLFAEGKYLDELRMSGNDLAGTPYLDHLPDALRDSIRQHLERAQRGGMQSTEIAHDGQQGESVQMNMSVGGGLVPGGVTMNVNVTTTGSLDPGSQSTTHQSVQHTTHTST